MAPDRPRPRRRAVLVGLAASAGLAVSGCGVDLSELRNVRLDDDEPFPDPTPGPDELARRAAVADAARLRRAATAAAQTRPELAAPAAAVAAVHATHLEALGADDPGPTPTAPPPVPAVLPPEDLPAAEIRAAATALAGLVDTSGGMARLLASIAAADVVAARLLAAVLGQPPPDTPSPVTAATATAPPSLAEEPAAAVEAAVRGAHAATYGYGLVAARLQGPEREAALQAMRAHEAAAEVLAGVLEAAGRQAPVPEPGYEMPGATASGADVRALAVLIEDRAAALHAEVVAAATGGLRLLGADLLLGAAVRAAGWRGAAVPLPGLAEP